MAVVHGDSQEEPSASGSSKRSCGRSQNASPLLGHSFHQRGMPGGRAPTIPQYTSPRLPLVASSVKGRTFIPQRSEHPTLSVNQLVSGIYTRAPRRSRSFPLVLAGDRDERPARGPSGVVSLENGASNVLHSASSACSINCHAPERIKSVSGSQENPLGWGNAVMVSLVMGHSLFSARIAAREQRHDMPPLRTITNFQLFMEDRVLRDFLVGQKKNSKNSINFTDYSVKERWSSQWKTNCRARIKGCAGMIGIITRNTTKADGQLWELKCTLEERVPLFLIHSHNDASERLATLPAPITRGRIYDWTEANIVSFLDGLAVGGEQ